ncbi:MAG: hypothetical protein KF773_23900 [Deltaproteobacteria bacterium]|nr:hypothetical protein [Deltaproteobacteria bacterium]
MTMIAACNGATSGEDQPPTLEVTSPERGTTADSFDLTVTGKVTDDNKGVRVLVNGVEASVAADGTFSAAIHVDSGISVIETHAIDSAQHDVRDVRAVLAGSLGPTDGSAGGEIAARISAPGFGKVGDVLAGMAQALDWKALALGMNPVATGSGCNGVHRIDIQDLRLGTIGISAPPGDGALDVAVTIDNVYVKARVQFEAICIGGSATGEVRATRANINGRLAIGVDNGSLAASLPQSSVSLQGFSLDINNVPGAIESLVRDRVRRAAEDALNKAIRDQVPKKVNELLGGLIAKPLSTNILSKATSFSITPAGVGITPDGMVAAVNARVRVEGGEGGVFAQTGTQTGDTWNASDVGIALAGDLVNQLFGGLWASGAIAPTLSLDGAAGVLAALLDDDARSVAVELKLPPTVKAANGALELAIGDLILSVRDQGGAEIQRFALSVKTSLSATGSSGAINVTLGTPTIKAQVLAQSEVVDVPMTDDKLEGLVNGAWGLLGGQIDNALGGLPIPSVAGMSFGAPALGGRNGFLVVDLPIQ